mgnify:CR=1 FL=1
MFKRAVELIKPVSEVQLQAFYTDKFQLFDIIEVVLSQLGFCNQVVITSFSISEEFLRKIYRFREKYKPGRIVLIRDTKAAAKVQKLNLFLKNSFDEVWLTNNHGKVVLFDSSIRVSICTSQNQTRGNRKESHLISTCDEVFYSFYNSVDEMKQIAVRL